MKYRVRADLIFKETIDAEDLIRWFKTQNIMSKLQNIAEEKSYIELQECHHDESPPKPCLVIKKIVKE